MKSSFAFRFLWPACASWLPIIAAASTFAPTREELAPPGLTRPQPQLDLARFVVQTDATGKQYYQFDDRRYSADAVQLDAAFTAPIWNGGMVYYQFAASVSAGNRTLWRNAAAEWSAVAALTFVESTGNGNYIYVKNSDVNNSYVGMSGGAQEMNIADWNYKYIIAHEIGHALGLEHEQSRSDREAYVVINFNNIEAGHESNFERIASSVNHGSYDFDSVMHYARLAFSRNGQNTIQPRPAYSQFLYAMGQLSHLSTSDKAGMTQRYARPENDMFVKRVNLPGHRGSVTGSNAGAGKEPGEPYHYGSTGSASVWYTWRAPGSGSVTFDTNGSNFDTVLAAYTGNSLSQLTQIASNDDSYGIQSKITFSARAGVTYQIAVDSYSTATGNFTLNWKADLGAPNDSFSARTRLYGASGSATGSSFYATKESSEPNHAGNAGGASVWHSWTAPATGPATFDTLQSDFDTLLAVYSGGSLGSLSHIASNDNAPGVAQSSVTFSAIAGVTYQIAVDGYYSESGNFTLRWAGVTVRHGKSDFNGDGQSDLLWQRNGTGERGIWMMNGHSRVAVTNLRLAPQWEIAGGGDFNGDGQADIVWQNTSTGQRAIWLIRGGARIGSRWLPTAATSWVIAGTGDFDGDGETDLLWQNKNDGARAVWLMKGSTHVGVRSLPKVSTAWEIMGTGEFNGDGHVDIVWQNNTTGQRAIWLMNRLTLARARFLPSVSPQWGIAGTGRFNQDTQTDIVWQNTSTGQRAIWFMNGTTMIGTASLPTVSTQWEIRNR